MKRIIAALFVVLLLAAPALAEVKIGFVDLQKALNMSKAGVAAKQEIGNQMKKYEAEFRAKQDALRKQKEELEKQAVLLSDDAKAQKERDFQQNLKELQRFQKDVKDEMQGKDTEFTNRILNEMLEVLQGIGKEGGYTMIVEKKEGAVIYADDSIDLTDELIKAYDNK